MKLQLADYCIRCGICEDLYPDLFRRNYETHSMDILYEEIPPELEERARQASDDCAVAAIKILP
ncbi:MAG: ferredoxin [Eubacterium sp.]|jgi:ferredoxin